MDWDYPLNQYPAKTNSYEAKFEADRAMAQRMSANPFPTLLTPQAGCANWPQPFRSARPESFATSDAEKQIAALVSSIGGWFNLFVLIFLAIIIAYQMRIIRLLQDKPAQT